RTTPMCCAIGSSRCEISGRLKVLDPTNTIKQATGTCFAPRAKKDGAGAKLTSIGGGTMAAYDGWGYPGRRARARQHGGYDHGWAYGRHGWRLPDWWGDPYDPRYAGFQLPRRYPRERYDGAARREFHEWLDDHPTGSTTYGRGMTDEELRSAVRRRLYEDPALDAERIQVEVNDRIVRLSGT